MHLLVKVEKPSFTIFLDTTPPHMSRFIERHPLSRPAVSAALSVTIHPLAALTQEGVRIILRRNQRYQYVEVFSASFSLMEIIATLGTLDPVFSLSDFRNFKPFLSTLLFVQYFRSLFFTLAVKLFALSHTHPLLYTLCSFPNSFLS